MGIIDSGESSVAPEYVRWFNLISPDRELNGGVVAPPPHHRTYFHDHREKIFILELLNNGDGTSLESGYLHSEVYSVYGIETIYW